MGVGVEGVAAALALVMDIPVRAAVRAAARAFAAAICSWMLGLGAAAPAAGDASLERGLLLSFEAAASSGCVRFCAIWRSQMHRCVEGCLVNELTWSIKEIGSFRQAWV